MTQETAMTPTLETARMLRSLHDDGALDLPLPGAGRTRDRHRALFGVARQHPVGVARLAEAHVDAVAILHEAGREPSPGSIYGVWASSSPGGTTLVDGTIDGTKRFCSGLGIVDRALVVASTDSGAQQLLDVDARLQDTIGFDTEGWATVALSDTSTGDITYTGHRIDADALVGAPGWYLERPGFWHGACGPAACWAGATSGLIDAAGDNTSSDPHQLAHLGAMEATRWALEAMLDAAGDEIDAAPDDIVLGERRARSLRHTTERLCSDVLDRFGRAFGPRPFVGDAALARRFADTHIYLRQHHGERELGALAKLTT